MFWHKTVPIQLKYASAVVASALALVNVHPNVLVTLGPPALIGSWFLNSYRKRALYARAAAKITPDKTGLGSDGSTIRIAKYDEASLENVLSGIESEFDSFRTQVLELIERRIADHVAQHQHDDMSLFMDSNHQISVIVDENDVETFVSLKYEVAKADTGQGVENTSEDVSSVEHQLTNFNVFSVPFYSSRNKLERRRLGVIEAYLVQLPVQEEAKHEDYNILLEITPFKLFPSKETIVVGELGGLYESKKYRDQNKTRDETSPEEITVQAEK